MDMGLYGQYYYEELGYNIFTADLRGHGGVKEITLALVGMIALTI